MSDFHPDKDCPKRFTVKCETPLACGVGCLYDNDSIHPNRTGGKPLDISKDWCLNMASKEGDAEIGAGLSYSTCPGDGRPCYIFGSPESAQNETLDDVHWRCGTSSCRHADPAPAFSSAPMEREVIREAISVIEMMSLKIKPSASEASRIDVALFYLRSMEQKP